MDTPDTEKLMDRRNPDHDLLVRLDTKVEVLIGQMTTFIQAQTQATKELGERVARLEVKDRGDSEKVQAISIDVQRSLSNHAKIEKQQTEIDNLKEEVRVLRSKAGLWDAVNAAGVVISGVIGFIFGNK